MADPKLAHYSERAKTAADSRPSRADIAAVLEKSQAFGVDLGHLRANLALTPAQRLDMLQAGLRMVETLRRARPL